MNETKIIIGDKELNNQEESIKNNANPEIAKFEAYGGFWRRYAAIVLDYWPVYIAGLFFQIYLLFRLPAVTSVILENVQKIESTTDFFGMIPSDILILYSLLMFGYLGMLIYNITFYFKDTRTLGYRILGMEIIDVKNGLKPSMGKLWGRIGGKFITLILLVIPIINIIAIVTLIVFMAKSEKRAIHDRIAGTSVVLRKVEKSSWVWMVNIGVILITIIMNILSQIYIAPKIEKLIEEKTNSDFEYKVESKYNKNNGFLIEGIPEDSVFEFEDEVNE